MSLGPCAEALGISVMMVFMLGVIQLPIMVALALHYPAIRIDIYNTAPQLGMDPATNQTGVMLPPKFEITKTSSQSEGYYMHGINISGLFVLCAAGFAFFIVLTMNLLDRSRGSSGGDEHRDQEYTKQNLPLIADPSFQTWNQSFVAATLLLHIVVVVVISSPVSIDLVLSSSTLIYCSLCQLVQPLDNHHEEDAATQSTGGSLAAQGNMLYCIIYCGTVLFVMTRIPIDEYIAKTQVLLVLACLDAFMLFGHMWDKVPILQVVMNCRLLYICMLAVFNIAVFCFWNPYLATPFVVIH